MFGFLDFLFDFYHQHPEHLLIEVVLGIFVFYMLFQSRYKPKKEPRLSDKEVEELVKEWTPAPLHQELTELQKIDINTPLITGAPETYVIVNGKRALNLATTNYLGLVQEPGVKEAGENALRKYGCGSCGPRGFYGTIDIHMELEGKISKFLDTEETVTYSSGFAAFSSAIPTFSKREDLIIADVGIHFALKTGINLSRSEVKWFEHNNIEQLEKILEQIRQEDLAKKRKLQRRFLVIEGLYQNHGDFAPLDKIMQLKEKYCFRIFLEDSNGIGVVGKTGRGTCELFGVQPRSIEFVLATLGSSFASTGGFCCASHIISGHQRLNSSGYVFSASTPPYLSACAIEALNIIQSSPEMFSELERKSKLFHQSLENIQGLKVIGAPQSPLIHLRLTPATSSPSDRIAAEETLQRIVERALEKDIALSRAKYVSAEGPRIPDPSICIFLSVTHPDEELVRAASVLKDLASEVFAPNR